MESTVVTVSVDLPAELVEEYRSVERALAEPRSTLPPATLLNRRNSCVRRICAEVLRQTGERR